MAKKKKKTTLKRKGLRVKSFQGPTAGIPKKGLLDPSLRRDIGNVPGLARVD